MRKYSFSEEVLGLALQKLLFQGGDNVTGSTLYKSEESLLLL